jgi:hypothetical protein
MSMRYLPRVVTVIWDSEARVLVAESDDIPGLITEAENRDELLKKLTVMVPELLELNPDPRDPTGGFYDLKEPIDLIIRFEEHLTIPRSASGSPT